VILSTRDRLDGYVSLHPLFARAFDYIRTTDLLALAPGRHAIAGDDLFVIVEDGPGRRRDEAQLECHRKYIDIQLVVEGVDEMGWKALADCTQPVADYSEERDVQFFRDAPASWIATPAGACCIFFPEDAHAPRVAAGNLRKVIVKVADVGSPSFGSAQARPTETAEASACCPPTAAAPAARTAAARP